MEERYNNTYIDNKFDEIWSSMRAVVTKLNEKKMYTIDEAFYIQDKLVEWYPEDKEKIYELFRIGVSNNE